MENMELNEKNTNSVSEHMDYEALFNRIFFSEGLLTRSETVLKKLTIVLNSYKKIVAGKEQLNSIRIGNVSIPTMLTADDLQLSSVREIAGTEITLFQKEINELNIAREPLLLYMKKLTENIAGFLPEIEKKYPNCSRTDKFTRTIMRTYNLKKMRESILDITTILSERVNRNVKSDIIEAYSELPVNMSISDHETAVIQALNETYRKALLSYDAQDEALIEWFRSNCSDKDPKEIYEDLDKLQKPLKELLFRKYKIFSEGRGSN